MLLFLVRKKNLFRGGGQLSESSDRTEMTKLGKQLENPYSVENMKKALASLEVSNSNRASGEELEITTTHLYIRFKPQDESELDILNSDTTLVLYTYPLDYEIEEPGDFYHDPEIPLDQPTYQYCAVEVDKELPDGVAYEILEELFIPDETGGTIGRTTSSIFVNMLVDESLQLTGNLEEDVENSNARINSWRPSGRIRVWDDIGISITTRTFVGYDEVTTTDYSPCYTIGDTRPCPTYVTTHVPIYEETTSFENWAPVVGLEVRARRWFTTHKGTTSSTGRFSCNGTFRRPANYSIKWEKYHFSIRSGTFGQATYNGPKKSGNWDVDIGKENTTLVNDKQQYYALIFQGAYDYYYGNRFGLESPPRNSFWKPQVKISASQTSRQHKKSSHAAPYARTGGIFPSVYVRKWGESADIVYAVTCHELAHMSHWDMDRDAYREIAILAWAPIFPFILIPGREAYAAVIESWAEGVEWQFAQERYGDGITGYEYRNNSQDQRVAPFNTSENELIYTSVVIDMIDDCDQNTTVCYTTKNLPNLNEFPQDRVTGYTLAQIEQGLKGARSWEQWRDNMIDRHTNPTEDRLNELFANWY